VSRTYRIQRAIRRLLVQDSALRGRQDVTVAGDGVVGLLSQVSNCREAVGCSMQRRPITSPRRVAPPRGRLCRGRTARQAGRHVGHEWRRRLARGCNGVLGDGVWVDRVSLFVDDIKNALAMAGRRERSR